VRRRAWPVAPPRARKSRSATWGRPLILAIETSCDDTCAAVVDGAKILSNVISSQDEAHAKFGGIVPEVASRNHLELAVPVVESALDEAGISLDDVEAIAVTTRPGLIGALLVGLSTAKALAAARRLPLIPVDHLQGHVAANFLGPEPLDPPFLCLVASGGHTMLAGVRDRAGYELLGQTLDDAAGEAFDKVGRLLGLGYPGGPELERLAAGGEPEAFEMPVAMARDPGLDFSFSGLKTALAYLCRDLGSDGVAERRADLAAGFQAAAVGQLSSKLKRALRRGEWEAVALGGGVAANGPLREAVTALCEEAGVRLKLAPLSLCTDNAAMIGAAARFAPRLSFPDYLGYDARPTQRPAVPA
jgi:tRNA N6-adenosine threonylcarbamoyltransferase